jgi:hypothetical protein
MKMQDTKGGWNGGEGRSVNRIFKKYTTITINSRILNKI